jgi:hypothetical protein
MLEINRRGHLLNSVTPDINRRIERAQELTRKIAEIQCKSVRPETEIAPSPYQTAENLGIYRHLGVTREQVKGASQDQNAPNEGPKGEEPKSHLEV